MTKPNLFGSIAESVRKIREIQRDQVKSEIWARNKISPGSDGYKIEEDVRVLSNGKESVTYKLWKLVDESELLVELEITSKITHGVKNDSSSKAVSGSNSGSPI